MVSTYHYEIVMRKTNYALSHNEKNKRIDRPRKPQEHYGTFYTLMCEQMTHFHFIEPSKQKKGIQRPR